MDYTEPGYFAGAKYEDFIIGPQPVVQDSSEPATATETVTTETVAEPPVETVTVTPEVVSTTVPDTVIPPDTVMPPTQVEAAPATLKSWKDALKEDGFDDNDIKMLEHRKVTGTYKDYLENAAVNFKDMSAEEIMRRDLREQYPNMSAENFERYYRKTVIEKYSLDTETSEPEDTLLGKELLEQDASAKRQKYLEKQASFTIPDRNVNQEAEQRQAEQNRQQEEFKQQIVNNPVSQALYRDKKMVLDAGDGIKFNYEIANPQELTNLLTDPKLYQESVSMRDPQGNIVPDFGKTMLLAAVAKDPQAIFKALINYGKSLGKKEFVSGELENASTTTTAATPAEETLAQAFMTRGVRKNW